MERSSLDVSLLCKGEGPVASQVMTPFGNLEGRTEKPSLPASGSSIYYYFKLGYLSLYRVEELLDNHCSERTFDVCYFSTVILQVINLYSVATPFLYYSSLWLDENLFCVILHHWLDWMAPSHGHGGRPLPLQCCKDKACFHSLVNECLY